jgi:hypothetical protein
LGPIKLPAPTFIGASFKSWRNSSIWGGGGRRQDETVGSEAASFTFSTEVDWRTWQAVEELVLQVAPSNAETKAGRLIIEQVSLGFRLPQSLPLFGHTALHSLFHCRFRAYQLGFSTAVCWVSLVKETQNMVLAGSWVKGETCKSQELE